MNQEFYQDLEKRMYSIALFGELFSLLKSKGRSLDKYGFERLDQQILLFFMVLRFIMEKTLASEPCFLEDIAQAIREINRDVFCRNLSPEDCMNLARLCVSGILCNQGEPFFFDPIEGDERWKVRLNYLNSEIVYQGSTPRASYKMSDDGFHLMLSTLEMEENMQLQFRDLVFELQMKSGNYPKALDEIREIFQLLRIQEREIESRSVQARSNAAFLNGQMYIQINQQTYDLMNDSREKLRRHQKNVEWLLQDLHHTIQSGTFTQKDEENLDALTKIHQYLGKSILAHASILEALNHFSRLLDEQLEYQLRQSFYSRRPFKQAVWKTVMDEPAVLENFDTLLHSFFMKPPKKSFSLEKAFQYGPLRKVSEDGSWQEVDESYDEEAYEKERQKAIERVDRTNQIIGLLIRKLIENPGHSMRLSELLEADVFESANQAREVLCAITSVTELDLQELYQQRSEIIMEEQTAFSLTFALLEILEQEEALRYFKSLKAEKAEGKAQFAVQEGALEIGVQTDDLQISLERRTL